MRDDRELRQELSDLRLEVSQLRHRCKDVVAVEALLEERSGREVGEGQLRQANAKLEEALARETAALRGDNADLRASLTDSLRLLSEERRERQADVAESGRRLKELQHYTEERTQRIESFGRQADSRAAESKGAVQEAEKLREMSEHKLLNAVAKEARDHEASLQREQQSRESMCAELDARWRSLLNEEKQLRAKDTDALSVQLGRMEDALRSQLEAQGTRTAEVGSRSDDLTRRLNEELRARQVDAQQMTASLEELRGGLINESRDRQDADDATLKRAMAVEGGHDHHIDRIGAIEKELMALKQNTMDLRGAAQAEATTREEIAVRLGSMLDNEIRARERAIQGVEAQSMEAEQRLEQLSRSLFMEEQQKRDASDCQLEAKLGALQHDQNFEKAKTASQSREVSQAIQVAREAIGNETAARRQELGAATKALDEMRDGLSEVSVARDRGESRLTEQVSALDAALRDEAMLRESAERKAGAEKAELMDGVQRLGRGLEELKNETWRRFEEDRRVKDDADFQAKNREEAASKVMLRLQSMVKDEQEVREQGQQALQHRTLALEQALGSERGEREDFSRFAGARLTEAGEELAELRTNMRDVLGKTEDLGALRDAHDQHKSDTQVGHASLDATVRDHQARLEQLSQAREQLDRRLDSRAADLFERIDSESRDRASADQDCLKKLAEEHADRAAAQAAERRHVDEALLKSERSLLERLAEERSFREAADGSLEAKAAEMRESLDGVRKWRVEQYNELVFEMSKVSEMLSQEASARQQQDQVLAGEISRLREDSLEESTGRKIAVRGVQEEVKEVLQRLERECENWLGQERERWRSVEELRDLSAAEISRREAADSELKQMINKEILTREEAVANSARAWQRANTQTVEDMRAALQGHGETHGDNHARLEQGVVELKHAVLETRSVIEQHEDETQQRFNAAAEALADEETARKSEDELIQRVMEEHRQALNGERQERMSSEQLAIDRVNGIEAQLQEEVGQRENGERRTAKEILECQARLQTEQASREDADVKLEARVSSEVALREEACLRETKMREEADSAVLEAGRRSLHEESAAREDDRKDLIGKMQQVQRSQQQEHEERMRADRELSAGLARVQNLLKEEEDCRVELGERVGVIIERLQADLRATGPAREELLRRAMEFTDQARGALSKEMDARSAKVDAIDEAVREARMRLADETQARDASVRAVADALVEERVQREDAVVRERHATEEDTQRTLQALRKAREEDERHVQERLGEITGIVTEERNARAESLRCERQKLLDVKEELTRDQKALERETAKFSQALALLQDGHGRRGKDFDATLGSVADRCDTARAELAAEVLKRETEVRNLEQRTNELQSFCTAETRERREADVALRKCLEEETNLREAALAASRRAALETRSPLALQSSSTRGQSPSPGVETAGFQADLRQTRQALAEVQERLAQQEVRQKSAEERTVSMLDAIMSGLTSPGD